MLSWPSERLVLKNLGVVLAPGLGGVSRQSKRQLLIGWYYSVILVSARGWFSVVIKSSVSLREDQHAFAKALVAAGRFPSVSAVLQQGLDLLQQQDADAQADRAALQVLLEQRANGPFISGDQLRARLAAQPR